MNGLYTIAKGTGGPGPPAAGMTDLQNWVPEVSFAPGLCGAPEKLPGLCGTPEWAPGLFATLESPPELCGTP